MSDYMSWADRVKQVQERAAGVTQRRDAQATAKQAAEDLAKVDARLGISADEVAAAAAANAAKRGQVQPTGLAAWDQRLGVTPTEVAQAGVRSSADRQAILRDIHRQRDQETRKAGSRSFDDLLGG